MIRRTVISTTVLCGLMMAAACGSDKSTSPAAPSPQVSQGAAPAPAPPSAGIVSGASISGTVLGATGASGFTSRSLGTSGTAGMTVSVAGTTSSSTVDAAGHFALQGVPAGHVDLHFSGAGTDAHLGLDDVAEQEDIRLTVRVSGSTADIDEDAREAAGQVEVEGRVAQISAAAGTMRIGETDISVPSGTPIRHGSTVMALSDIHVGDRLHVRGTKSGALVTATTIEVQANSPGEPGPPAPTTPSPKPPDPGDDTHGEVDLSGTLTGRSGTCPALTFKVSSTTVVTSASTKFDGTSCSALANGDKVEVKGSKSSSGSVSASSVEKKK